MDQQDSAPQVLPEKTGSRQILYIISIIFSVPILIGAFFLFYPGKADLVDGLQIKSGELPEEELNIVYYKAEKLPKSNDCVGSILETNPVGSKEIIATNAISSWCVFQASVDVETGVVVTGGFRDLYVYRRGLSPKHIFLGNDYIIQGGVFVNSDRQSFITEVSTWSDRYGITGLQLIKVDIDNGSSSLVYNLPEQVSGFLPQNRINAVSWNNTKDKLYSLDLLVDGFVSSEELFELSTKGELKSKLKIINLQTSKVDDTLVEPFYISGGIKQISFSLDKTKLVHTSSNIFNYSTTTKPVNVLSIFDLWTGQQSKLLEDKFDFFGPQISPNNKKVLFLMAETIGESGKVTFTDLNQKKLNLNNFRILDIDSKVISKIFSTTSPALLHDWGWVSNSKIFYTSSEMGSSSELHVVDLNNLDNKILDKAYLIQFLGNTKQQQSQKK